MDEPTSSLDEREVEILFEVIRQLKASGVSVIYISHRLDELYEVCDNVTIMRDGQTIEETSLTEHFQARDRRQNAGQEDRRAAPRGHDRICRAQDRYRGGAVLSSPAHIEADPVLNDASIELRNGRDSRSLRVARLRPHRAGARALRRRQTGQRHAHPRWRPFPDRIAAGCDPGRDRLCSEDRKADGIIPDMSVRENLTLAALPTLAKNGIVDPDRAGEDRRSLRRAALDQDLRCRAADLPALRRQPAEGAAGPLALPESALAAARRTDPRASTSAPKPKSSI